MEAPQRDLSNPAILVGRTVLGRHRHGQLVVGRSPELDVVSETDPASDTSDRTSTTRILGDKSSSSSAGINDIDGLPIVSQLKSLTLLIFGDTKGAKAVQEHFFDIWEDHKLELLSDVVDSIPGVGTVKGVIQYVSGNEEAGLRAIKASYRTTLIIGAGIGGMVLGGPLGSIAAGVAAGAAYDGAFSVAEKHPQGVWALLEDHSAGTVFDTVVLLVSDGYVGRAGGQLKGRPAPKGVLASADKAVAQAATSEAQPHVILTRGTDGVQLVEPIEKTTSGIIGKTPATDLIPTEGNLKFTGKPPSVAAQSVLPDQLSQLRQGAADTQAIKPVDIKLTPSATEYIRAQGDSVLSDRSIKRLRWESDKSILSPLETQLEPLLKQYPLLDGYVRFLISEMKRSQMQITGFVDKAIKTIQDVRPVYYLIGSSGSVGVEHEYLVETLNGTRSWHRGSMLSPATRRVFTAYGTASTPIRRIISQRRHWVQVQWGDGSVSSVPQTSIWAGVASDDSIGSILARLRDAKGRSNSKLSQGGSNNDDDDQLGPAGHKEGDSDEERLRGEKALQRLMVTAQHYLVTTHQLRTALQPHLGDDINGRLWDAGLDNLEGALVAALQNNILNYQVIDMVIEAMEDNSGAVDLIPPADLAQLMHGQAVRAAADAFDNAQDELSDALFDCMLHTFLHWG